MKWGQLILHIIDTTKRITALKEKLTGIVKSDNEHKLLDWLFVNPTLIISEVQNKLDVSKATAYKIVNNLVQREILIQTNKGQRYKQFLFKQYMDIIEADL